MNAWNRNEQHWCAVPFWQESHGLANRQVASGHRWQGLVARMKHSEKMGIEWNQNGNMCHIDVNSHMCPLVPIYAHIFRYQHTYNPYAICVHTEVCLPWMFRVQTSHTMSNILICASGSGRCSILGLWAQSHLRWKLEPKNLQFPYASDQASSEYSRSFRNTRPQHHSWTQSSEFHLNNMKSTN